MEMRIKFGTKEIYYNIFWGFMSGFNSEGKLNTIWQVQGKSREYASGMKNWVIIACNLGAAVLPEGEGNLQWVVKEVPNECQFYTQNQLQQEIL